MTERVVYFNGRIVPERDARLSIYDSGVLAGEMAFEVTRTVEHRPFRLEAHIDRLYHSLAGLHIDPRISPEALLAATNETLARNLATESPDVDWNIIHNISRGPSLAFAEAFTPDAFVPTIIISCYPLIAKLAVLADAYASGVDLVVPPQRSIPHELLDTSLKTRNRLHYQLANRQADEILPGSMAAMVDTQGFLTEGTSGNLFVVRKGRLDTPTKRNLLPGVTRQVVLELAAELGIAASECDITPAEIDSADEVLLTSTTIGILHARTFNGRRIASGEIGPVTTRLRQALHDYMGLDIGAEARRYRQRLGL
jgi:branched-chain amino acid aminotransferase